MWFIKTFESFTVPLLPEEEALLYFDKAALYHATKKEYEPLCYIPIDDFLAVCNAGYSDEKYTVVNAILSSGTKFNEIPYLCFNHDNNGTATVVGHEGRHRAKALKFIGVKTIPVLMKSFMDGEGSYAINKENLEKRPDYFEEEFPVMLRGELENKGNVVPFPITL